MFLFYLAYTAETSVGCCCLGCGKCPVFPREVGMPTVSRSPVSNGTTFVGECCGPARSQCCLLPPDVASSAVLPEVSQMALLGSGVMGCVRERLVLHLWTGSFPSDGSWWTLAATPLYLCTVTGFSHHVHLPNREKYFCSTGPQGD